MATNSLTLKGVRVRPVVVPLKRPVRGIDPKGVGATVAEFSCRAGARHYGIPDPLALSSHLPISTARSIRIVSGDS